MMPWRKCVVFIIGLVPLMFLVKNTVANQLGPDPGKTIVLSLGFWALSFLWLSLAISPLKRLLGITELIRYRRMLGLYCWFYACLHLMAVAHFLLGWDIQIFIEEFSERPYMALGITAWLMLLPLGLTSNKWAIKKLARRWKSLHHCVYVIAVCAMLHFWWQVRSDYSEVLVFAALLLLLLTERMWLYFRRFKRLAH